jgi:hypothetical protein
MVPARMAALMFDFFANTSECVVKGPPELVLPLAWQLLLIEHTEVSMGCTSVENLGLIPAQENVIPLLPPDPAPFLLLLLQAVNRRAAEKTAEKVAVTFFIIGILKSSAITNVQFLQ